MRVQGSSSSRANLHHGVFVGGVVNELAVSNVHSGMRDVACGRTEKEQITRLKIDALDRQGNQSMQLADSASRGMITPRDRISICVNPEQSNPKLEVPPHK